MEHDLEGKVAIVTGSSSGIGQAIAKEFASHGADVAITWFEDEKSAEDTRTAVEAAGRKALVMEVDVRAPSAIAALFQATEQPLGTPYILVNDAGIDAIGKEVAEMSIEEWEDRFRTNVHGPFYACQQFIRARRKAGGRARSSTSRRFTRISRAPDRLATAPPGAPCGISPAA